MGGDDKRTNYGLWCALCKLGFNSREEWYDHLVGDEHQVGSRLGMMGWGREEREAVLVAFCSEPVDKEGGELVKWITGGNWRVMVTDFVWWGERPRVAFVRFESRKAVEMVLERGQGQDGGMEVKLQKASDFSEEEWDSFFPEGRHQSLEEAPEDEGAQEDSQAEMDLEPELSLQEAPATPTPESPPLFNNPSDLLLQFEAITEPVQVPVEEWTSMVELLGCLDNFGKSSEPPFQVQAYRHSYLKLRLPGYSTSWLIYVSSNGSPLSVENVEDLLKQLKAMGAQAVQNDKEDDKMDKEFYLERNSNPTLHFTLVTFPQSILEAQLSQLTKYLLGFDPRCIPLLGLIYFWCSTNKLGKCMEETSAGDKCLPVPAALEWMLISFLGSVARIIPTARQVLERPHTPVYIAEDNSWDLGFDCDTNYYTEWKEGMRMETVPEEGTDEFYLSVVELAQQFFQHFGTLLKNTRWILNSKDGEMLLAKSFEKKGNTKTSALRGIKLSPEEVEVVRKAVEGNSGQFYVTNPLYPLGQLGLRKERIGRMQKFMRTSGIRLKNWLVQQKGEECGRGEETDLARVLKVTFKLKGWSYQSNNFLVN